MNTVGFGVTAGGTVIYAGVGDSQGKWAAAGGIYTSTVGNTSVWHQTGITNAVVLKLRVDPSNPQVVYAGGGFANPKDPVGALLPAVLYKTTDGGATWRDIRPELPQDNAIRAMAIDPLFPNNVFFSFKNKVYQSVDGGNTWSLFSDADLGGEWVAALLVPLAAPSPVITFTTTVTGDQAVLSWRNPTDTDFAGVTIRYSTQGFPMLSSEGITLTTTAGLTGAPGCGIGRGMNKVSVVLALLLLLVSLVLGVVVFRQESRLGVMEQTQRQNPPAVRTSVPTFTQPNLQSGRLEGSWLDQPQQRDWQNQQRLNEDRQRLDQLEQQMRAEREREQMERLSDQFPFLKPRSQGP